MDDRSFVAAQDFILAAKTYWTTEIYPALKQDYDHRAAAMAESLQTADDVNALIGDTTLYRYYAWLERHLQRYKYAGRYGLAPYHDERRAELLATLDDVKAGDARLELDAGLDMPPYYSAVDIHQHPGGVWSDEIAGFVYERGARSTTPLMGGNHRDLHQRFTDFIAARGAPKRILDMGCGFGKSTGPFVESFPDAAVEAIDLAGPCVAVGAREASRGGAENVRYRQMNAYETDYSDGEFDLVTSTMLIHELPPPRIAELFDEAARVLSPGGRMVHLDFYALPDAFSRFIHYGHGRRNNEPFMEPWAELDVIEMLEARGFRDVEIVPFREAEGVDADNSPYWRFPWTVIAAEKAA